MITLYTITGFVFFLVVSSYVFTKTSDQFGAIANGQRLQSMQDSKNYKDGKFFNLEPTRLAMTFNNTVTSMWDFMKSSANREPTGEVPVSKVQLSELPDSKPSVVWLGHSSILVKLDKALFLVDPVFSVRTSPISFIGPKRFTSKFALDIKDIIDYGKTLTHKNPGEIIDAVFITHDHYDHLDHKSILALKKITKKFYVPLGVASHLERWGVSPEAIVELDWWQESSFTGNNKNHKKIKIVSAPTRHFSGRSIGAQNSTQWTSWILIGSKHKIYCGGDSGYSTNFKEIGKKYGPFDITMLESGAYSKYWPDIHMAPEETVEAHLDLRGRVLLPIHWSMFNLSLHSWTDPIERLIKKAELLKVKVLTPGIGEPVHPGETIKSKAWWRKVDKKD